MKLRAEISDLFRTLNESSGTTAVGAFIGFGGAIAFIAFIIWAVFACHFGF